MISWSHNACLLKGEATKFHTCCSSFTICWLIDPSRVLMWELSSWNSWHAFTWSSNMPFIQEKIDSNIESIIWCSKKYVQAMFFTRASSAKNITCWKINKSYSDEVFEGNQKRKGFTKDINFGMDRDVFNSRVFTEWDIQGFRRV